MTYNINDIISLKLISGDEIMGKLVNETNETYLLDTPVLVMFTGQGKMLLPALMSGKSNNQYPIKKNHVMYDAPSNEEDERVYVKQTSGIELPRVVLKG